MSIRTDVDAADLALCRSALYEALALGFRWPTVETLDRLASADGSTALSDAAAVLDRADGTDLARQTRALAGPLGGRDLGALGNDYPRLFGHTARGPVPPYETEYGVQGLFQQPQEMSDIAGFLRAFGLTLNAMEHERVDHMSCECEFLAFLARKEAHAVTAGNDLMAQETRKAARLFLRDHLARFGPAFARKLTREDSDGFYGALGELCLAFLSAECSRYRVSVGSEFLQLRPVTPGDAPMACGPASDLLNIEDTPTNENAE